MNIISISNAGYLSGGTFHDLMTIQRFDKFNIGYFLIIKNDTHVGKDAPLERITNLPFWGPLKYSVMRFFLEKPYYLYYSYRVSRRIKQEYGDGYFDVVYSHHENFLYIFLAFLLSAFLKLPKAALLCAPPFHHTNRVRNNTLQSYDIVYRHSRGKRILKKVLYLFKRKIDEILLKIMLRNFSVIGLSSAIAEDMGESWSNKIRFLNPKSSYEHMHVPVMQKEEVPYDYDAIFFARLSPEKGIFDLPLIWKEVTADGVNAKLAIAGKFFSEEGKKAFFTLIDTLSLNEFIDYVGWLPHNQLIQLLHRSKLVIYPSYFDSISMVVVESLANGRTVVAYDIPAMRHNFPIPQVVTVPIGDYKEMAQQVKDMIDANSMGEPISEDVLHDLGFQSWDKVSENEIALLKKIIRMKS